MLPFAVRRSAPASRWFFRVLALAGGVSTAAAQSGMGAPTQRAEPRASVPSEGMRALKPEQQQRLAAYQQQLAAEQRRLVDAVAAGRLTAGGARDAFKQWRESHPAPWPVTTGKVARPHGPPPPLPPRAGVWKAG